MVYIGFLLEIPSYLLFHTFFSDFTPFLHTFFQFFISLCTPPHSYQSIKKKSRSIPTTVLKFWVETRFCDTDERRTATTTTAGRAVGSERYTEVKPHRRQYAMFIWATTQNGHPPPRGRHSPSTADENCTIRPLTGPYMLCTPHHRVFDKEAL